MIKQNIKNISSLLVIGLVLLFSSCGDKNECENVSLNGKWEMSASYTEILLSGVSFADYLVENLGYTYDSALYASAYPEVLWDIEFKSDKSYTQTYMGNQYAGTWSLEDGGNSILMDKGTSYEMTLEILSLSKDALLVTYSESGGLIDFNEDGEYETLEFVYNLAFEKVD